MDDLPTHPPMVPPPKLRIHCRCLPPQGDSYFDTGCVNRERQYEVKFDPDFPFIKSITIQHRVWQVWRALHLCCTRHMADGAWRVGNCAART